MTSPSETGRLRVLFLNWRDSTHPEGGGSEEYVERVAERLVGAGHQVTIFCAAHGDAPSDEVLQTGVRVLRRGGRFTVYLQAISRLLTGRMPAHDVIVDVQNGVPFWSVLVGSRPVLVLCHHVHREQWRVVLPRHTAALGWWLESRVAPRVYRPCRYVTVSNSSRNQLAQLGVDPARVSIVYNGVDAPPEPDRDRSAEPEIAVLGRLVPHKRVELAMQAVAVLRRRHPGLSLTVVGHGYWEATLRGTAERLGIADRVTFTGFVDDRSKTRILSRSWVLAMPSLKEGWGITVMEAATHGTPAVGFHGAGGIAESIVDGHTGILCGDFDEFVAALDRLLTDAALRRELGERARTRAQEFSWDETARRFARVLGEVAGTATPRQEDLVPAPRATAVSVADLGDAAAQRSP